ncbi:MAG: hypothetical protein GTO60_16455 [Gammaproteobacteria bacterium]|nr:hypothetical protein [Gammaproteobacteria bacterium]
MNDIQRNYIKARYEHEAACMRHAEYLEQHGTDRQLERNVPGSVAGNPF